VGIVAFRLHLDVNAWKVNQIFGNLGDHGIVQVGFQPNGLELAGSPPALDQNFQVLDGFPQDLAQEHQGIFKTLQVGGNQKKRIGGNVGREDLAISIGDDAPGRFFRDQSQAVGIGQRPVGGIIKDLKIKKFTKYGRESDGHDGKKKIDLLFGRSAVFGMGLSTRHVTVPG
jgi:hypothetical protein